MAALTLRIAGYQGEASVHTRAVRVLADTLAVRLGQRGCVEFLPDITQVGKRASDLLSMVEDGALDLCYFSSSYLAARVPALGLFDLPFAVSDRVQVYRALAGDLGDRLAADVAGNTGYRVLGYWDNGFRHVSNRLRPIRHPDDCRGMRIRTLDSALHRETFAALGFEPVTLDVKHLVAAVERHEVDAQENPLTNLYHFGMHRTHRHLSLTGHLFGVALLLANRPWFDALAPELHLVLRKAAGKATDAQRALAVAEDESCRAALEADGVTIVAADALHRDAFRRAVAPIVRREAAQIDAELLAMLGVGGVA
jgi:TRAP-type C4-dicarboxylate transport system substrate-binding protein